MVVNDSQPWTFCRITQKLLNQSGEFGGRFRAEGEKKNWGFQNFILLSLTLRDRAPALPEVCTQPLPLYFWYFILSVVSV